MQGEASGLLAILSAYPRRATSSLYGTVLLPSGGLVSAAEIQEQTFTYAHDTGTANAYAIALSPAPSIGDGSVAVVKIANTNTGASTLTVNAVTAPIKKDGTVALAPGDLVAGEIAAFVNDGTNWQLLSGASSGGSSPSSVTAAQIQQESLIYAADTGTANAYAISLSPAPTIVAGSVVVFKAANANTGTSTLAVNGVSAALTKNGTYPLVLGDIAAGQIVEAKYDGTQWQAIGLAPPLILIPDTRGISTVYFASGSTISVPWPSGTQSGDLVVIVFGATGNISSTPTGWTLQGNLSGSFISGGVLSKTLNASDIAAGSVTLALAATTGECTPSAPS